MNSIGHPSRDQMNKAAAAQTLSFENAKLDDKYHRKAPENGVIRLTSSAYPAGRAASQTNNTKPMRTASGTHQYTNVNNLNIPTGGRDGRQKGARSNVGLTRNSE